MGACDGICKSSKTIITKQVCFPSEAFPISQNENNTLLTYESALCKIKFKIEEEKEEEEEELYEEKKEEIKEETYLIGIGFFCEINDDNIPIKKALFTNNHVLNESNIKNNKIIELEYLKEKLVKYMIIHA